MLPSASPPAVPEPGASSRRVRAGVRLDAALQNGRLLAVILAIILSGLVARTLLFARETQSERAVSEMYEKFLDALDTTKSAYSPALITGSHPPLVSPRKTLRPVVPRPVAKWQALTRSRYARASEWRRLAITRALFGQPGALDAIAHIDDPVPDVAGMPRRATRISKGLRSTLLNRVGRADPFGHGAVNISSAQEHAFWNALYGPRPLASAQVPALRQTLLGLHMGWFSDVAQAQLYQKAGLSAQARQSADDADRTAQQVRAWGLLQVLLVLAGFAGVFFSGLMALARRVQRPNSNSERAAQQFAARPAFDFVLPDAPAPLAVPAPVSAAPVYSDTVAESRELSRKPLPSDRAFALFPASALLLAFVVYLLGHTFLGLAASYALRPFVAGLEDWSASRLLRLETGLEVGLYVPVFLLPLLTLQARVRFDPFSGAKLRLGVLLRRLGYHTRGIAAEISVGAWAYLLTLPAYLLISALSHWMFKSFHTPVNPAQFETLTAHGSIDKLLVFVMAAVLAPIIEETMFRGLLYSALRERFGIGGAAALSAAVFAAVHPTLPGGFLPIWCLGVALALVYERRGSLLPGMVLHGIHNGLIVMMGLAVFG